MLQSAELPLLVLPIKIPNGLHSHPLPYLIKHPSQRANSATGKKRERERERERRAIINKNKYSLRG